MADPKQPYSWVYFPESGIASVIAPVGDSWQEIGLFGRDGAGGVAALLSAQRPSFVIIMQVAGHGHRIPLARMAEIFQQDANVRDVLLQYVRAAFFQLSQSALANTQLNVEQRLARWLLMAHDRLDGDMIKLTHEYLAIMLGVSRTTVTLALHALERAQLIRRARAQIIIADRAGLEQLADNLYRMPEPARERVVVERMRPEMAEL
jgi:CRP-like cAMP-binding protein